MIRLGHACSGLFLLLAASSGSAGVVGQIGSSAGKAAGDQYVTTAGSVAVVQQATAGAIYRTGALSVFDGTPVPGDFIFSDGFDTGGAQ